MAYKPSAKLVKRWESELMAKIHGLEPGDRVTLNTDNMAVSLRQYCRDKGITEKTGVVLAVKGQRVCVEWIAIFTGWFDADALTAETVQPGLFV